MKLKFQLSEKISKFEALLSQKEKYDENATGKEIIEKKKNRRKIRRYRKGISKRYKKFRTRIKSPEKEIQ